MLVFGLTDYIGAHLFPFGEYFVGFTISAIIKGLIYGVFLYPGNLEFPHIKKKGCISFYYV